jgi:hypothetical protein
LTYALVEEGLKTDAADIAPKDGQVEVREWIDYATSRVPQMQEMKIKELQAKGESLLSWKQKSAGTMRKDNNYSARELSTEENRNPSLSSWLDRKNEISEPVPPSETLDFRPILPHLFRAGSRLARGRSWSWPGAAAS